MCLAFESMDVGQQMLAWATKFCLFPDDEVYIVHCLSKVQADCACPSCNTCLLLESCKPCAWPVCLSDSDAR